MRVNKEISELVGIMLGDGSLSSKKLNPKSQNRMKISFNSKDDADYLKYVKKLLYSIFKIEPKVLFRENENTAELLFYKKKAINFLTDEIGLKTSPKWNRALIPNQFLNQDYELYILRGYIDTDGCLVTTNNNGTIYPRIEMKISPSPMQEQFIKFLNKHKFNFGVYKIGKGKVRIQLNGKSQLKKWINLIGFNNKKHQDKIKRFLKKSSGEWI